MNETNNIIGFSEQGPLKPLFIGSPQEVKEMFEDKLLVLNLKKQWYEMIESGEKKEEYREIKDYWVKRLCVLSTTADEIFDKITGRGGLDIKHFDKVKFVYGYTKRNMAFKINDILVSQGETKWGAEKNKYYFVIKIGDRIS